MSRLFPELDDVSPHGVAGPPAPPDAAEKTSIETLLGAPRPKPARSAAAQAQAAAQQAARQLPPMGPPAAAASASRAAPPVADERLRTRFEKILALPGKFVRNGLACRVVDVGLDGGDRLRIDVAGGPIEPTTFYILPAGEPAAMATTPHLSIVVRGSTGGPWIERLAQQFAIRLERGTMSMLVREIAPSVDEEYENSLGFGYNPPGAWRNFLQGHENSYGGIENSRGYCQNVTGNTVSVSHTEIECVLSSPPSHDGSVAFWNHIAPDFTSRASNQTVYGHLFSDLGEMDVIKGGTLKLDRLLDSLAASGQRPDALVITSTCTTTVIGDDTQGSIEKLKRKLPILAVNMSESRDVGKSLFDHLKAQPGFADRPRVDNTINLAGLPRMSGCSGLFALLEAAGITVNSWLLPDIEIPQLERYMSAPVQVLHDWATLDPAYQGLVTDLPIRTLRPPPPFGIAGTRAWLLAIGEAFGRASEAEAAWTAAWSRVAPRWEALRAQARVYRLGFVGDERMMRGFFGKRALFGIPILDVLGEMGFGIDLYVHAEGLTDAERQPHGDARRVTRFESREDLESILANSNTHAFYSEIFFDRRITRTGKNVFSVRDFGRVGLDGALEALQRLVLACQMPFYRSYSRYLGAAFDAAPKPAAPTAGVSADVRERESHG